MSLINDALKRARQAQRERRGPPPLILQPADQSGVKSGARGVSKSGAIVMSVVLLAGVGVVLWQFKGAKPEGSAKAITATNLVRTVPEKPGLPADVKVSAQPLKSETAGLEKTAKADEQAAAGTRADRKVASQGTVDTNGATVSGIGGAVERGAGPEAAGATALKAAEKSASVAGTSPAEPVSKAVGAAAATALESPGAALEGGKTEEWPAASVPASFPNLKLQGIYYRIKRPSALINNRTVHVGDTIEGARVVSIQRLSVKLEMGGQTRDLSLR